MTVGSSQTCGKQITGILTLTLKPDPTTSIAPGLAVVNISATDDDLVGLPNSSARLLNGRSFAGISVGFNATMIAGTNQPADNQIPCQRDGIVKAQLKANTACTAGQEAAYDPADGGYIVPYTSAVQVPIGKFVQTKASSASAQYVGVELTPGAASLANGGLLLFAAPQAGTASSTAENAYTNATLTLPANFLRVGDVLEFGAGLITSAAHSTDTVILRWKIGSTAVVTSTTLNATANDLYSVRGSVSISAIGASGVANGEGTMAYGQAATDGVNVPGVAAVTVDTTSTISLTLTEQWSVSDAGNLLDLKSAWYRLTRKSN
jgi:hypothetical protein